MLRSLSRLSARLNRALQVLEGMMECLTVKCISLAILSVHALLALPFLDFRLLSYHLE